MKIKQVGKDDFDLVQLIKPSLSQETFNQRLEDQSKGFVDFLVLEDAQPIGFVLLKWNGKPTHPEYPDIEDLYVKDGLRGKGYGSILIKECESRAKKKGCSKIGIAVNPTENSAAKSLYVRLGFKQVGYEKYLDGVYNGVEDWVVDMEKSL